MPTGKETIIRMRLSPNTQSVDRDYVLKTLLNLSAREDKADLVPAAKQIIELSAQRGSDTGLFVKNWEENYKKLGITQSQYFYIIKILRRSGIIDKSKGKFHVSKKFVEHIRSMVKTMDDWNTDLKVY